MTLKPPNREAQAKQAFFLKSLSDRVKFTPDIKEIKFYKYIPMFVYGIEKSDGPNWVNTLKGCRSLGRALTVSDKFVMRDHTYQPVVFHTVDADIHKARIKGEVYLVEPDRVIAFDRLYQNGLMNKRISQRFMLYEGDSFNTQIKEKYKDIPYVQGFMYIAQYKQWKDAKLRDKSKIRLVSVPKIKTFPFYEWNNPWEDEGMDDFWGRHVSIH